MEREWDEIDREAAHEGAAIKRAFRRTRIRDGSSKVPLKEQSHDYRAVKETEDLLAHVIDGRRIA